MSTNEIILAIFAAVLVVFSLVVAIVVPKRNPDFPGKKMGAFFLVSIALVAGMLTAVEVFADEEEGAAEAAQPAEPSPPGETGAEPGGEPPAPGDPAAGKEVFLAQPCGSCHALADAGTSGAVGPNLDESKPSFDLAVDRVTNGSGAMPAFGGTLSGEQIQDVAAYIVQATAG